MKESRKAVCWFYDKIRGKRLNQYSCSWAAKFFHDSLQLMIQLGLYMLPEDKQSQTFACSTIALQMASNVFYNLRSPRMLVKDKVKIILEDLFREAKKFQVQLNEKE